MAPTALTCKECGHAVPARGALRLRAVLRAARGRLRPLAASTPAEAKRKIQAGPAGIWRYADFLPFAERPRDPLQPGLTPLVRADRLAERLGLGELWIKNDAANPTHSFKDRVVAVALAKARELGFETVACASTGNLANAVAAHAAAAGLESYVFVPADLEEQKLLATGVYGTRLVGVHGNYDDVNRLCTELAETRPWAFVNVNLRPYYAEGSKTIAYEIVEQLGWELPDRVVCPIASGSLFTKIGRGFERVARARPGRGRAAGVQRRPGGGLQPGGRGVRARAGTSASRSARRRSPRASRSATRPTAPYALELARAHRRLDRVGHRRRDPGRHPAARRDDRDLHRDRRRRDHGGAREARRARRDRSRPSASSR